ncbi:hypothetical protein GTW43_06850, partial [Streptomyces sp. SID5785]|uniref:zf-HC2 domain-containing protein n=1 Tax=Streptomyces sp. SID5785 TaxID=2690309 RepID=UPI001360ED6B
MADGTARHTRVKRLLGVWVMDACDPLEADEVAEHLKQCADCAAEAEELRGATELLHPHMDLDLPPGLRAEVLGTCLSARPPQVHVPDYARPFDAETARLDALLTDMGAAGWEREVRLEWLEENRTATRGTTVSGVLGHLLAVDGLVSSSLGLPDPVPADPADAEETPGAGADPLARTERFWEHGRTERSEDPAVDGEALREQWREHAYELIRTCSFGQGGVADIPVPYGEGVQLPLRLALLDRAFETWIHATDIADAVDHPYPPPVPDHLRTLIGVAVQMLPAILAARRQAGLAAPPRTLLEPGTPGRSVR